MPFPTIRACIVCESVRQEPRNKLNVLGLFGMSPHVEMIVDTLAAPLSLAFLLFTEPGGEGTFRSQFRLLEPNGNVLFQAPPSDLAIPHPPRASSIAFG